MQCVTAVDPLWLAELGPVFFSIKDANQTRADKRKKEKEDEKQMHEEAKVQLEKEREEGRKHQQPELLARKNKAMVEVGKPQSSSSSSSGGSGGGVEGAPTHKKLKRFGI